MAYGVRYWLLKNQGGAQECVVKAKMVNQMVHQRSVLCDWTDWGILAHLSCYSVTLGTVGCATK